MSTLEQYLKEARITVNPVNSPQIDKDYKTIYPKDSVVEINEGGTTSFIIHSDNREYQIKIRTDTLLSIIKKKNKIEEDENFVQCGEYGEKSDFIEITEDDLYGR